MASGTMVSRLLGFIRSAMLLAALGAAGGGVSAAFQTANTLPNTVFNLLASGVFDAVLVPQIVSALKRRHDGDAYVNKLLTLAGTILFAVTVVATVAAPLLVIITAAGYDAQIRSLAIAFAFLCLPQIFFYGLYNLLGELLNARGVFGPYMWAPVVNNIVGIAGLAVFIGVWGSQDVRIDVTDLSGPQFWVLAGSATLGVVCQALFLLIPMRHSGVSFRPDFRFRGTSFGSVSTVAGWTFATLGVSQIGVLSTNNIAALADAYAKAHDPLIAGVNAYATAFMIFMVPQSVITVSLTTAIFTRMAAAVADDDDRGVASSYHLGVRTITSLTLLAAAILMAGAMPMMQMVLFSQSDQGIVAAYAWVLAALMPGVASTGMVLMSQRVFFAYEDVRPVFLMGIGPTLLQVVVGWSMYALTGAQWWVIGAALGETACRLVQGVVAVVWVARRNRFVDREAVLRSYSAYLVCAAIAGVVALGALWVVGIETGIESNLARFAAATGKMVLVGVVASVVYMAAMRVVSPVESARTIRPLLVRLRLPGPLVGLLAEPAAPIRDQDRDNGRGSSTERSRMDRDDELGVDDSAAPDKDSHDSERVPGFDEIFDDGAAPAQDGAGAPAPLSGRASAWVGGAGAVLSAWAARLGRGASGGGGADALTMPPPPPDDLDDSRADRPVAGGARAIGADTAPTVAIPRVIRPGANAPAADAPAADGDAEAPRDSQGRRLIDPTTPTLVFAAGLVVVAGVWATATALSPVTDIDLAQSIAAAQSAAAQSGSQSDAVVEEQPAYAAPVISSVSVLSWNDDGGDHEDLAVNMIDANPQTSWRSRWYDLNQFRDETSVTILVKLQETATVSSVSLQMDPTTQGGEIVVKAVSDTSNPRGGTELTTSALSESTQIALPEPVTADAIALSFRSLPVSVDGNAWAWIYELTVQ
ncbi:hypothetical protein M3T53_02410 [Actinomyces sp. B33]|nr:lipid II flippase MurJ [Actinomyces sp. B33]MDC4232567.1 hypothetical protein [Actinomyces sp. B33]